MRFIISVSLDLNKVEMENFKCPEVKFPKNVLLMDVAFVNREVASMRRSMSWGLKRELPLIDMYKWLSCLALDGDVVHVRMLLTRARRKLKERLEEES